MQTSPTFDIAVLSHDRIYAVAIGDALRRAGARVVPSGRAMLWVIDEPFDVESLGKPTCHLSPRPGPRSPGSIRLIKPIAAEQVARAVLTHCRQIGVGVSSGVAGDESSECDDGFVCVDPAMRRLLATIDHIAATRSTVLMVGESGTGKSMLARRLHQRSLRPGRLVEIGCGSLSESLMASELFGHVRGAYTAAMQVGLLRVLQEREIEPLGAEHPRAVDVRFVAASGVPLEPMVRTGVIREDFFFRINVVRLDVPPLRERPGDVLALARRLVGQIAARTGRGDLVLSRAACDRLSHHRWPGNVRELQNVIERAAVLTPGTTISADACAPTDSWRVEAAADEMSATMPLDVALERQERAIILAALRAHDFNRAATAAALRIERTTLYRKMRRLGLDDLRAA
jgi:DNA-binding NtrC family response regulator